MSSLWTTTVKSELHDPDWDRFVAGHRSGDFRQSTPWAAVKASAGWRRLCLQISDSDGILAGAQILARPLPIGGLFSYTTHAPLLGSNCPKLRRFCLEAILELISQSRTHFFIVQPSHGDASVIKELELRGFEVDLSGSVISATTVIDLRLEERRLFGNLRQRLRSRIRRSIREGVEVVDGGINDLPRLHSLMVETCRQQGVPPHPPNVELFEQMWKVFSPTDSICLKLARFDGRVIAAELAILFGKTVSPFKVGWSREWQHLSPVPVIEWTLMREARARGYTIFDFMGIDPRAGQLVGSERTTLDGASFYKLGFGGKVVELPPALEYVPNRLFRHGYRRVIRPLRSSPRMRNATSWVWSRLHG